ncbi:MAG TPA: choice-of-anchor Q domain-containing protein, partial [Terracidiphilus sp.]
MALLLTASFTFFSGAPLHAQRRAEIQPPPGRQLSPLSMVSADFDEDGAPDVAVGYGTGTGGTIILLRGNREALAPQSVESFRALEHGQSPDSFLPQSAPVKLQAAPAMLLAADVDGDGHRDLVYASKGSATLQVMFGTGHGTFRTQTASFTLPGAITALASYTPGVRVAGDALLVGYNTAQGARVALVGKGKTGLEMDAKYALPGTATAIAVAQLDSDLTPDAAIVAGGHLVVLHGYQAIYGKGQVETLPESGVLAVASGSFLFDRHQGAQLSVLTAGGELVILAHQGFDSRAYTRQELVQARLDARHNKHALSLADRAGKNGSAPWVEIERRSEPAFGFSASDTPFLLRTRASGAGGDDLVVLDQSTGQRVTISHRSGSSFAGNPGVNASQAAPVRRVKVDSVGSGDLIAAIPMRVNADGRPGLVTLGKDETSLNITVPAANNTFYVTTTADGAPAASNGTLCSNPDAGGCTLRDAVTFANEDASDNGSGGSDTILVPAGTYTLSYLSGHKDSQDNSESHLELYGPVTIIGSGAGSTIIDGDNNDMIFNVNPGPYGTYNGQAGYVDFDAALESVTLQHGANSDNPSGPSSTGLENDFGGCIFWSPTGGNLTLTGVDIQNCSISWGGGGAIYAYGDGGAEVLSLTGGSISGNTTSEQGGAIHVGYPAVTLTATNTAFANNLASATFNASDTGGGDGVDDGGALYLEERQSGSSTAQSVLTGVTISGNTANGPGGGIYSITGLKLLTSTLSSNISIYAGSSGKSLNPNGYNGGGVYIEVESPESAGTITSTNFLGNSAYSSGGGVTQGPAPSSDGNSLTISLSRFYGNTATSNAGSSGLAVGEPGEPSETTDVGSVVATENWWGCNAGPLTSGNGCDQAEKFPSSDPFGNMQTEPHAELAMVLSPTTLPVNSDLGVTVSLNTDSNSNSISNAFPAVTGAAIAYNVTGVGFSSNSSTENFASNGTDSPTISVDTSGSGTVSAQFDGQTVSQPFNVTSPPIITSGNSTTFTEGTNGYFTVTTNGSPNPSLSESGSLPNGVTFTNNGDGTATLTGTATQSGTFPFTITATNGTSPDAVQNFTLTVNPQSVQLTESASPSAGGTVSPGSGSFDQGAGVSISATPNSGYTFLGWTSSPDSVASPSSASTSIVMNSAETVTANFSANLVVNTPNDDSGVASNCTPQSSPGTNSTDSSCSLRDALLQAASLGAGSITFDSTAFAAPQTITLIDAKTLKIPSYTSIIGATSGSGYSLANLVTVDGGGSADPISVFTVNAGVTAAAISNLTITDGYGTGSPSPSTFGGGIHNEGNLTVSNSTFINNSVEEQGGAIYDYGGNLTIQGCTFTANSTTTLGGGAIYGTGDTITVNESTFSGNTAIDNGGAIVMYGSATVTNSTFIGNKSMTEGGGAIGNLGSGALIANNNVFSGNTAVVGAGIDGTGPTNANFNLFYNNVDNGGGEDDCYSCASNTNEVTTNPNLAPLANFGGPTQTALPLPGSGAICAASSALIPAGVTNDQRGMTLDPECPANSVDAGAVQSNYMLSFTVGPPSSSFVNEAMRPSPRVTLMESGNLAGFAPSVLGMTDSQSVLSGTETATTAAGVAIFGNLTTSAAA